MAGEEVQQMESGTEDLSLLVRFINHILTPGSSLTLLTWIIFNCIMFALFLVWLSFAVAFPYNVHVWVFGVLGLGLAGSTNWLMKIVFREHIDFSSTQQEKVSPEKKEE